MIVIVCGVSGTGKSTIGALLAAALDLEFYDADDFHPQANIAKMQKGGALNDADRQPWLEALANNLADWAEQGGAVLACSALKQAYRVKLAATCRDTFHWVFLHGTEALLSERLRARKGHFFEASMLRSQLDTLEPPNDAVSIDVAERPEDILKTIVERLPRSK